MLQNHMAKKYKADIKRALFIRLSCTLIRANAQILVSRSLHFAGRTEITLGGDPI